jgi:hypothetical protein
MESSNLFKDVHARPPQLLGRSIAGASALWQSAGTGTTRQGDASTTWQKTPLRHPG